MFENKIDGSVGTLYNPRNEPYTGAYTRILVQQSSIVIQKKYINAHNRTGTR